jgi:hypothetical protein
MVGKIEHIMGDMMGMTGVIWKTWRGVVGDIGDIMGDIMRHDRGHNGRHDRRLGRAWSGTS